MIERLLPLTAFGRSGRPLDSVMGLVIHWTAVPGQRAEAVWNYYAGEEAKAEHFGSAHYLIDIDGEVTRAIPEDEMAYHVGSSALDPVSGLIYTNLARQLFPGYCDPPDKVSPNRVTLGVELCCLDVAGSFSPETLDSALELAAEICARYALGSARLLTHHDVVGWKDCPRWFVNRQLEWRNFKRGVFARITGSPSAIENERTGRE